MTEDGNRDTVTIEDLLRDFALADREAFLGDPALALQQLDRFLAKLPEVTDADRQRLRSILLGEIH